MRQSVGRIVAALLITAVGAALMIGSVSAEGPVPEPAADPVLDTSLPIETTVTLTMSDPVQVSGFLMDHDPTVWCRTQTARFSGSRGGSRIYSVTSKTYFCWDGKALASHDPRFSHRVN